MIHRVAIYTREKGSRKYRPLGRRKFPACTQFVLRSRHGGGGVRKWEILQGPQTLANAQIEAKRKELALAEWKPENHQPEPIAPRRMDVDTAITTYLRDSVGKSEKTKDANQYTLARFRPVCTKEFLDQIGVDDLRAFVMAMKIEGLSDRTAKNRVAEVVSFLRFFKITEVKLRVKYLEKKVRAYREDEIQKLFSVATPEQYILFRFFLESGCREQEVEFATWSDLDFVDKIFTVTAKPQFGFTPKDFEEREVRLSDDLTAKLKQRKFTSTTDLIFPNPSGKPDGHFLRKIKKMAVRAGMDPNNVGLHIFRKTFATLQHRNGVDARTIQRMLGHSDLATTLAYLEPENVRSEGMAAKVNETFAQFTGMGK